MTVRGGGERSGGGSGGYGEGAVEELPPKACRPLKNVKKNYVEKVTPQKVKKNNVDKEGPPPAPPPARPSGVSGGGRPPARGKRE